MAKSNRKAWSKREFDLAINRKVLRPVHRTVKLAQLEKRQRRRNEQKLLNLSKFKREKK